MNQLKSLLSLYPVKVGILLLLLACTFIYADYRDKIVEKEVAAEMAVMQKTLDKIITNTYEPYRFPLDTHSVLSEFAAFGQSAVVDHMYHSAIDYFASPGEPVYAVADGIISFAAPQREYGGLIIIDHPQDNLYSLYGHTSVRRWYKKEGLVKKGELIGYVADLNEGTMIGNFPHIHFSIRMGLKKDYPVTGPNSWMIGYNNRHPIFFKFIDPEAFIAATIRAHR